MNEKKSLKKKSLKMRVFEIIEIGNQNDKISRLFDFFITFTIFLNLFILVFDTFDYPVSLKPVVDRVEMVTVGIFTIEYALRLWTSSCLYPQKRPRVALVSFVFSFYGLVDLLSILPYFLVSMPAGMAAFRLLRVIRVFKLFRINAQYDAFNVVLDVLNDKKSQIFSSVTLISAVMLASSLLMYSVENPIQPDVFKNALSGLWWSVSAIFTVGYGDIYPISTLGQILAIIISFFGVMLVAIPTGIISAGFVEQYTKIKKMSNAPDSHPMKFIMLNITKTHPWMGDLIKDISFPPEMTIVAIIRNEALVIPRGKTPILEGDSVVVGVIEYKDDFGILLLDEHIGHSHPWKNKTLMELSLPGDMVIVSVKRDDKVFIPKGSTKILENDCVTYCEKRIH